MVAVSFVFIWLITVVFTITLVIKERLAHLIFVMVIAGILYIVQVVNMIQITTMVVTIVVVVNGGFVHRLAIFSSYYAVNVYPAVKTCLYGIFEKYLLALSVNYILRVVIFVIIAVHSFWLLYFF